MTWPTLSVLRLVETIELIICLATTLLTMLTLKDAKRMVRLIRHYPTADPLAKIWVKANYHGKLCLTMVQLFLLALCVDRLQSLYQPHPVMICRALAYGAIRMVITGLIAFTALSNMIAFRQVRNSL